ncbi:methyltransferase domain-containing protein [Glycomyces xiaoerkulensis]|uniref:methyltransferase domain-containing protein n=1 Tax=Glycomyces xiaoerkulensis TaxID=2038139 RepID=UPI000C257A6D|nr:methyltransferase domain-containing protein [Glycomyces xiaoerkulensis]
MTEETATYTHGHHESVLRSHRWRTAENSAAYLLPHLEPGHRVLDVGCGPGTITADLAGIVAGGRVAAVDRAESILDQAAAVAAERGLDNVAFAEADVHDLPYGDGAFDAVHAHQVLQHVSDPVRALREMRRVTRPGGVVAARDSDYAAFLWYPESPGLTDWLDLYGRVARANGGEPDAGRRLKSWALRAGFPEPAVEATSATWTFSVPEDRAWWGGLWADRALHSDFATRALEQGHATRGELEAIAAAWREWAADPEACIVIPHGQILCRAALP